MASFLCCPSNIVVIVKAKIVMNHNFYQIFYFPFNKDLSNLIYALIYYFAKSVRLYNNHMFSYQSAHLNIILNEENDFFELSIKII